MRRHGHFASLLPRNLPAIAWMSLDADPPPASGGTDAADGTDKPAASDKPPSGGTDKAAADKPVNGAKAADGDRGFPADTPVNEMTAEQQAAYWKHHARRHEADAKTARGDLDAEKRKHLSDSEKALADARDAGRKEGRADTVRAYLEGALAERITDADARELVIAGVNPEAFVDASGGIDRAKIRTYAATITAGTAKGSGTKVDTGGGTRGSADAATGREAGLAEARRRFAKTSQAGTAPNK